MIRSLVSGASPPRGAAVCDFACTIGPASSRLTLNTRPATNKKTMTEIAMMRTVRIDNYLHHRTRPNKNPTCLRWGLSLRRGFKMLLYRGLPGGLRNLASSNVSTLDNLALKSDEHRSYLFGLRAFSPTHRSCQVPLGSLSTEYSSKVASPSHAV